VGRYQRSIGGLLFRRPFLINSERPIISFTFDDFPASALSVGGEILNGFGRTGTYYASFGLLDTEAPTGRIFASVDLEQLLRQSHEIGCHTFAHCDAWKTNPGVFEAEVRKNRMALNRIIPGGEFRTLSYPISPPRPLTKKRIAKFFECCRAGGQTTNVGTVDLSQLSGYFIEKAGESVSTLRTVIDRNRELRGWLIFATHDVSDNPTRFGCTPRLFEQVVRYAVQSDALVLPVAAALEALKSRTPSTQQPAYVAGPEPT
jgi:peptidoglycan/xylan/chitin deacetylase (PgdA/CDA1 family)